jgi:hypothetical protein
MAALMAATALLHPASAEMLRVKFLEGTQKGYLALTTEDGKRIGTGELSQVVEGDRVRVRLVYRFLDGSIDDERAVFTQKGTFRVVTDRHIQKGPSFPHPIDVAIDVAKGEVTTRSGDGDATAETKSMDLPEDLANGSILTLLKNMSAEASSLKVSYVATDPKPRLVKLDITGTGDDAFRVGSLTRKARCFLIKIDIGGIAGVVAPLIGKQPGDIRVWIEEGEAPAFIREEGAFFVGGPVWISQTASPSWGAGRIATKSEHRR